MSNDAPLHRHFQTLPAAAERPHWAFRCAAGFGALLAVFAIALMAYAIIRNWDHVPTDTFPWLPLSMLFCMLALLWSGTVLAFRQRDAAILVFALSMLLGLPYTLFWLAIAFSD